jgi:hypothetical protein
MVVAMMSHALLDPSIFFLNYLFLFCLFTYISYLSVCLCIRMLKKRNTKRLSLPLQSSKRSYNFSFSRVSKIFHTLLHRSSVKPEGSMHEGGEEKREIVQHVLLASYLLTGNYCPIYPRRLIRSAFYRTRLQEYVYPCRYMHDAMSSVIRKSKLVKPGEFMLRGCHIGMLPGGDDRPSILVFLVDQIMTSACWRESQYDYFY